MSDMTDVLAWHRLDTVTYLVSEEEYLCICGKRSDNHEAHQSRALTAAGFGPVREAQAEGWRVGYQQGWQDGQTAERDGMDYGPHRPNPYREDTE